MADAPGQSVTPAAKRADRLYGGTPLSDDRLVKPFKCPGTATPSRASAKPARKRRKVDYGGTDGEPDAADRPWTNEDRLALANRDVNRFPVFKVKDRESTFRQRFAVPLINKEVGGYDAPRAVPSLGMRKAAAFIAKPLHDPSGEFAIVLYDPTVDDKPMAEQEAQEKAEEDAKTKLDVPIMHKSLADILGLKKQVDDQAKIPVVIDPRLSKVLRPHQVEGVKVCAQTTREEGRLIAATVLVSLYDGLARQEGQRLHHG